MLENIGRPGYETISRPDSDVLKWISDAVKSGKTPKFAEVGVGIGATTLAVCRQLNNRGEVHIFDYENKVTPLHNDLAASGFTNVVPHPNQRLHWDSYVWPLVQCLTSHGEAYFDYIYIDGAHTIFHDLPAYIVAKKLLSDGGILDFDDYNWSWGSSPTMNPAKNPWVKHYMTAEQISTPQVKLLIDLFVERDSDFEIVKPKKTFKKIAAS